MSRSNVILNVYCFSLGTKFIKGWNDLACGIALDAVKCVHIEEKGHKEIDIKRYAKVEKVITGFLS